MSGLDWLDNLGPAPEPEYGDKSIQGSPAWHAWRKTGMGGSDAAALLGWSPYMTAKQLYEEKLGISKREFGEFQKRSMQRGKDLEPVIRKWYEEKSGHTFKETVGESKAYPFVLYSSDGVSSVFKNPDETYGRFIEIKAPNKDDHAMAAAGEIPLKYLAQVNWGGIVLEEKWFSYISFGSNGKYEVVEGTCDSEIQAELIRRGKIMWRAIESKTEPNWDEFKKWEPALKPVDLSAVQIEEQEIEAIVAETIKAQEEKEAAEERFDALKAKLQKILGTEEKMQCGEAVFGWQTRKGSVEYTKIPEIQTVDLELYRKEDVRAFYFKRSKK